MKGRQSRVGGAAVLTCDIELDADDEDSVGSSISFFRSFSFVFRELGLGGGLSASSSSSWGFLVDFLSRSPPSKSKILVKFNPTVEKSHQFCLKGWRDFLLSTSEQYLS